MRFEKYLDGFEEYLKVNAFSERTIESYRANTRQFLEFVGSYYPRVCSLEKITKEIVLDYQNYLSSFKTRKGEPLSNTTQGVKLKAIKKFFFFLLRNDLILKDPSTIITIPREGDRLTRNILSEENVFSMLESIKMNDPVGMRNRAIVELFYSCGIRTSELCSLMVHDVDLKQQTVTIVKGKGNKSRILPIGQYASFYIQLYLDRARKYMLKGKRDDPGWLFLSQRGNPFNKSTINKCVMNSITRNMDSNKHISCYTMRHSVASHLLANNVDIMYIAKLLGHSSLKTTQRYLRIEIGDLKKMHSLYHPRERKNQEILDTK